MTVTITDCYCTGTGPVGITFGAPDANTVITGCAFGAGPDSPDAE
jgi:hypothetical protein